MGDNQTHRDEQGRFVSPHTILRYRIEVWDIVEGDLVEKLWEASDNDLDAIEEKYRDDPTYDILVEDLS